MCNRFRILASIPFGKLLFASIFLLAAVAGRAADFERADALDAAGKAAEALALLTEEDRRQPENAEILRRIAKQYDRLALAASSDEDRDDLLEKALDAAQRAVSAGPQNSKAHLCLAIVYGRIAQRESPRRQIELSKLIRDEAELATKLDSRNDIAWHVLGRWNFEMASVNPVLRRLAEIIYGKFPDASKERAVECFRKAIETGPPRVMHHVEYGLVLAAMGEKKDARKQLETGLSLPAKDQEDEDTQQRARRALSELR